MPIRYDIDRDEFDSAEEEMARAINEAGEKSDGSVVAVSLGIGASFLLYRKFMKRRLKEEVAKRHYTTSDAVGELAVRIFFAYLPSWIPTLAVGLGQGYMEGLREVGGNTDSSWARQAASQYASSLGDGINEVSVQALVEGINAQINRGVPIRAAVDRAIDAFGVAPKTMKSLVSLWTGTAPAKRTTAREQKKTLKDKIDERIAKAIMDRAQVIGETESRMSRNASKSMFWAYQAEVGDIPAFAEKEWITADDERTCPVCAPLHQQRVLVTEKFSSSIGKIMAPGVHPNCRCSLKLHLNLDMSRLGDNSDRVLVGKSAWGMVHKARGDDMYNRNKNGQFATQETRGPGKHGSDRKKRFKVYGENLMRQQEAPKQETPVFKPKIESSFKPKTGSKFREAPKEQFREKGFNNKEFRAASFEKYSMRPEVFKAVEMRSARIEATAAKIKQEAKQSSVIVAWLNGSRTEYGNARSDDDDYELISGGVSSIAQEALYYDIVEVFDHHHGQNSDEQLDSMRGIGHVNVGELTNDDDLVGDEPPEEWLRTHDNDPIDPVDDTPSNDGHRLDHRETIRANIDGVNYFVDTELAAELASLVMDEHNKTVEVPTGPSGEGFISNDYTLISAEDLLRGMGSLGKSIIDSAIKHKPRSVAIEGDATEDKIKAAMSVIDDQMIAEMNDPFNHTAHRGKDKSGRLLGSDDETIFI